VACQLLHSGSFVTTGTRLETSIQAALCDMIESSKNFVYMEVEKWVGGFESENAEDNRIGEALLNRVQRALREGRVWHCYLVLPLLPAMRGDIAKLGSASLLNALGRQLYALRTLVKRLCVIGVHPEAYLTVLGLRQWDAADDVAVTQQVYVHSKVAVADDERALVGSANCDDESLLGIGNSEVCVAIEGRSFSKSLRFALMAQHLGLGADGSGEQSLREAAANPASPAARDDIRRVARRNTLIFEDVFCVLPTERVRSWKDLEAWRQSGPRSGFSINAKASDERLADVSGRAVLYPIEFMANEELRLPSRSRK